MNNKLFKGISVLVNLIEGAAAVIALTMSYAFIFEKDNPDHSTGTGLLVLLIWMAVLFIPNIFLKTGGKFDTKDSVYYQSLPFIAGAGIYIIYQLVLH